MENTPDSLLFRPSWIWIAAPVIFLVIFFGFLYFSLQTAPPSTQIATIQQVPSPTPVQKDVFSLPQVHFSNYINLAKIPSLPESLTTFQLKSNIPLTDIQTLGNKLGLTQTKQTKTDYVLLYNTKDTLNRGLLTFNKTSGSFSYISYGDVKPSNFQSNQSPVTTAIQELTQLQVADWSLSCPYTYQRKDIPNVTYVECHRDWQKTGLPITNIVGLLNQFQPETPFTKPGQITKETPDDPTVYGVLENGNPQPDATGKQRANDFSTVTVGVTNEGSILSIDSSLRQITEQKTVAHNELFTPSEVLSLFQQQKATLSLTLPAGNGMFDWQKVYQKNQANANNATITGFILSYMEKPKGASQNVLVPMYTIYGYTTLDTGYRAYFIQTLPALKNQTTFLSDTLQETTPLATLSQFMHHILSSIQIHPVFADDTSQLQLKTFTPAPKQTTILPPSPTLSPTTPIQTVTVNGCQNPPTFTDGSQFTLSIPGLGQIVVQSSANAPHTLYYVSSTFPVADMQQVVDNIYSVVQQQATIIDARFLKNKQTTLHSLDDVKNALKGHSLNYTNLVSDPAGWTNHIYDQLWSAVQSQQLDALANQADLFPSSVIANFQWVYGTECGDYLMLRKDILTNNFKGAMATKKQTLQAEYDGKVKSSYYTCYITGFSPSLFLYPVQQTAVTITLPADTVYADPPPTHLLWQSIIDHDGTIHLSESRQTLQHFYYEYDPTSVHFLQPESGYVIPYADWQLQVKKVSGLLKLTAPETTVFIQEVKNALVGKPHTPYLQLSFAAESEINRLLPLHITPQPRHIYRFHIMLKPLTKSLSLPTPTLSNIIRSGFTVIEVGARVDN